MPLEYYLIPSELSKGDKTCRAVSRCPKTVTENDVFDFMTREGSPITKAETLSTFEEFMQAVIYFVKQGYRVVTPLVHFSSSLGGVFEDEEDTFDPGRHKVRIIVGAGPELKKAEAEIKVTKKAYAARNPDPIYYHDNASGLKNEQVTSLRGARITGNRLSFDEDDPKQGVFFINTDNRTETRVDTPLLKNKPKELIFMNPGLPPGEYRLEIRSIPRNSNKLSKGQLSARIYVGATV